MIPGLPTLAKRPAGTARLVWLARIVWILGGGRHEGGFRRIHPTRLQRGAFPLKALRARISHRRDGW